MIKITRVDERLVHGQVAFAWTNSLGADCILVVNDEAAADKIRATTLKLAAPAGIKFSIKSVADAIVLLNGTKTDKYKVFVIVGNTDDALKLVEHVKGVDHINLGNMKRQRAAGSSPIPWLLTTMMSGISAPWLRPVQWLNAGQYLRIKRRMQ